MPRSIAPLLEDFKQRFGVPGSLIPFGSRSAGFPSETLGISVELLIDGVWIDITDRVYSRDTISITRGKSDESNVADPSTSSLTLNNRNGDFSPRNPVSPYYGKIGRNTQLRISVDGQVRFNGEVSSWPQKWDTTGNDVWVPVEVAGILRRLNQGNNPLRSVLYRKTLDLAGLLAYWPCEDGDNSTSLASAIAGAPDMTITTTEQPDFAAYSGFNSTSPIPTLKLSSWSGNIPAYVDTTQFQLRFLLHIPSGGMTNCTVLSLRGVGTFARFDVEYTTTSSGSLVLKVYDPTGALLSNSASMTGYNNENIEISIDVYQFGSDVVYNFIIIQDNDVVNLASTTITGPATPPIPRRVVVNPDSIMDDAAVGQIAYRKRAVTNTVTTSQEVTGDISAYIGETAAARILRLCTEEGISVKIVGTVSDSSPMGPQLPATLLTLLDECAQVDNGNLYEPRESFGLAYRTRTSQYNRPTTAELDYTNHELSTLEPVDDDRFIRNDVTVTRTNGSSYRATLDSGTLSISEPPNGIGRYQDQATLNLESDDDLINEAGWLLHLGTVDEARYPVINLDLSNQSIASNPDLLSAILNLDIGDCLAVINPPSWLPPEDIEQSVRGYTEELNTFEHRIGLNCVPCSPYRVGIYNDSGSKYSSDGSLLASDVSDSATSLSVSTPSGPLWTTDGAEVPFDIMVGGERMTVTAIAGASSPQTFTVTRSVNGIVKAQPAGSTVELFQPVYYAL